MSHEIRIPINAVLGMNEMILRECTDKQNLQYGISIENGLLHAKKDMEMYLDLVRMFVKDRVKQDTVYQFLAGKI